MTSAGAAEIDTLTGRMGLTIIVMTFDVAGFPDEQVMFEVRVQVTTSLFARAASE